VTGFEALFVSLDRRRARYVMAGGLAALLRGRFRREPDVELMVDRIEGGPVTMALTDAGFSHAVAADPADAGVAGRAGSQLWSQRENPVRIVQLTLVEPTLFEGLWRRSSTTDCGRASIRVASVRDAAALDRAARRNREGRRRCSRVAVSSTAQQRLDWLDEMVEIARASGALAREVDRRRRERGLPPLSSVMKA